MISNEEVLLLLEASAVVLNIGFTLCIAYEKRIGWVLVDHVVGKYEFIDYAAGFDAKGAATGVEILVYRESHGAEIRNAAWRRQFAGARGPAQLRFNDDIRNISGATLSCQHLTEGVQRLSALAQLLVRE